MMKYDSNFLKLMLCALWFSTGCATTQTLSETKGSWVQWPDSQHAANEFQHAIDAISDGDLTKAQSDLSSCPANHDVKIVLGAEIEYLHGNITLAIGQYIDFLNKYPDSALSTLALSRILTWNAQSLAPLDWNKIASLRVTDPYAQSRLIILQSIAMRSAKTRIENIHPTALPLAKFQWMGPFSPYPTTEFDTFYPFDADPYLAAEYENDGKTILPYRYEPENQTIMAAAKDGVYAGETYVQTDQDNDWLLTVQSGQYYEIQVDGVPILKRTPQNDGKETIMTAKLHIPKGFHSIRVRLGIKSRNGSSTPIALWLSPAPSHNTATSLLQIHELDERPETMDVRRNSANVAVIETYRLNHILGNTIVPIPNDALRTWFGAMIALSHGEAPIADALLQSRLKLAPHDIFAQYLMAQRFLADADMDSGMRNENAMHILQQVTENSPQMVIAAQQLLSILLKQNQTKLAHDLWKQFINILPKTPESFMLQSELAQSLSWQTMSDEFILRAAQMAPSCALETRRLKIHEQGRLFQNFESLPPSTQNCPAVIQAYASKEGNDNAIDSKKWEKAIHTLSSRYPNDMRLKLQTWITDIPNAHETIAKQINDYLDAIAQGYRQDIATESALAVIDAFRAAGFETTARQLLENLTEIYPHEEAYQTFLWSLSNERPLASLRKDGMQIILNHLANRSQESGSATVILDYAATRFYPNGAKLGLTHTISRVLSKEGKNEIGEIYLPQGASILKMHTIKQDTLESIEPENIDYKTSITAPNLSIGDFIELEYITYEPPASAFNDRAVSYAFFYGADKTPLLHSEYVYEYPKDWNLDAVVSGPENTIIQSCKTSGNWTQCRAFRDNIQPIAPQPGMPSEFDVLPNIQVYHNFSWQDVKRGLTESTTRQTRITPYLKQFYHSLTIPQTDSVWERAKFIYNAVQTAIHESDAQQASDAESATHTVTRGAGSRLLMLKSLYDIAGIPNHFALVRSIAAAQNSARLPAHANNFYATYLVADTEKGPAYADPSQDNIPFDYLPTVFQNQEVIPIAKNIEPFVSRTDATEIIQPTIDITYEIHDDGTAAADAREVMRGARAIMMRGFLKTLKGDDIRRHRIIENSLAKNYGRVTLNSLKNSDLQDADAPLALQYQFDIANLAMTTPSELSIHSNIFAYNLTEQYAQVPETSRLYPLIIPNETISQRTLTFHAPANYIWQSATLENTDIDTPYGTFTRKINIHDGTLTLIESIELRPQRIELSDYPAFRNFCLAVDKAQRNIISAKRL